MSCSYLGCHKAPQMPWNCLFLSFASTSNCACRTVFSVCIIRHIVAGLLAEGRNDGRRTFFDRTFENKSGGRYVWYTQEYICLWTSDARKLPHLKLLWSSILVLVVWETEMATSQSSQCLKPALAVCALLHRRADGTRTTSEPIRWWIIISPHTPISVRDPGHFWGKICSRAIPDLLLHPQSPLVGTVLLFISCSFQLCLEKKDILNSPSVNSIPYKL